MTRPTDDEINDQIREAVDASQGGSRWPGLPYEEGVINALSWALGESDDPPMSD